MKGLAFERKSGILHKLLRAKMSSREVTRLLLAWSAGDDQALQELTPLVYRELHRLAHQCMQGERDGHTLQTSALVNEACLIPFGQRDLKPGRGGCASVSIELCGVASHQTMMVLY
jgi:hypothetical protein